MLPGSLPAPEILSEGRFHLRRPSPPSAVVPALTHPPQPRAETLRLAAPCYKTAQVGGTAVPNPASHLGRPPLGSHRVRETQRADVRDLLTPRPPTRTHPPGTAALPFEPNLLLKTPPGQRQKSPERGAERRPRAVRGGALPPSGRRARRSAGTPDRQRRAERRPGTQRSARGALRWDGRSPAALP